ncbi:MAG: hypothetical protein KF905_07810 [Flavobacteriales bacterium]|nr:hypothetical protein [Flavobacteriales bacterium]
MKWTIAIALSMVVLGAYAQHGSVSMYNEAGLLRADTSLRISQAQLERWRAIEDLLLTHVVDKVRYSDMARDGQVEGRIICSFGLDKEGAVGSFEMLSGPGYGMDQELKRALSSFRSISSLSNGTSSSGLYHIVLDLQFVDARSYIKEHGAIPIIGVDAKVIQH